jgi:hypothetical protein
MNFTEQINQLAKCEPTDSPFISIYLNAKDVYKNNYCSFLEDKYDFIYMEFLMYGGKADIFDKCWKKIIFFLNNNLKDTSEGLVMFLRFDNADGIFFVHEFPYQVENSVVVDGVPNIYPLIQLIKERKVS